ncbi:uncharacterized protein LOC120628906 [Pararge aegeria]|uniref:Jg9211 protein n=2 Tax=Pararge aegeria TaxID=116150 RepID=A0A8S4SEP6_9NEOP|nr:uncharacterized protein LOC120628906 [Pararge aegeria]CAH2262837.1 jg9211 [Pararge aegeria aegeria]
MRITAVLARVPAIKFRKGQVPSHGSAATAGSAGAPAAAPGPSAAPGGVHMQSAAAMSSAPISDIDLPPRYRRRPISQEEIDHINGGGVV